VYRIDLMKFSLLRRSLGEITAINLAGIRPHHEATVKLGDGKDYRDRETNVDLPIKEEGAYLVVARGENLHASGLVLVTPLAIEVAEEASSGRVRTTIKKRGAEGKPEEKYVTDVHVKVIGTRNGDFTSGETDLRGVFVADGIQGTSTVIAQLDARRYAFYRGSTELGPPPAPAKPQAGAPAPAQQPGQSNEKLLLEGLEGQNRMIQEQQRMNLDQLWQRKQEGVKAQQAY
jgi:hypothetical protein